MTSQMQKATFLFVLCRSWSSTERIVLRLRPASSETHGARIVEIRWEAEDEWEDRGQEEAKELAIDICNGVLGCALETSDST